MTYDSLSFDANGHVILQDTLVHAPDSSSSDGSIFTRGLKFYELSNHLGNVLATVSDSKLQVENAGNIDYFTADIRSMTDYYGFGMEMPGRGFEGSEYRFGFQGQETDQELFDGAISYKYRIHDPRVGKFLSVDPLSPEYPFYSQYAFSGNRVIDAFELEGLEPHGTSEDYNIVYPELRDGTVYMGSMESGDGYRKRTYGVFGDGENGTSFKWTDKQFWWIQETENTETGVKSFSYWDYENKTTVQYRKEYPHEISWPKMVLEISGNATAGLQAGLNARYGTTSISVDANIVNTELGSLNYDMVRDVTKTSVIGDRNGMKISNSIGLIVKENLSGFGLDLQAGQSQNIINGRSRNYQKYGGQGLIIPLLKPSPYGEGLTNKGISDRKFVPPSPITYPREKGTFGRKSEFYGIDAGIGATLIFGLNFRIRYGIETRR